MIIQIRGTSGSGKTTAMKEVMKLLGIFKPIFIPRRKRPWYYLHEKQAIIVLGHYESACGGCDTIGSALAVYECLRSTQKTDIVLCEGLLLSEDKKWTIQLRNEGQDIRSLFLTTPLEDCIERVKKRREEAGNHEPFNVENTTKRIAVIERARVKLTAEGIQCRRCTSTQAAGIVLQWIKEQRNLTSLNSAGSSSKPTTLTRST